MNDWSEEVKSLRAKVQEQHALYINTMGDDEADEADVWMDEVEILFTETLRMWYKYKKSKREEEKNCSDCSPVLAPTQLCSG